MATYEAELLSRVQRELDGLAKEFEHLVDLETFQRCADESLLRFQDSRVPDYVPLLIYRSTRERLRAAVAANSP